jgi:hypothetical protein
VTLQSAWNDLGADAADKSYQSEGKFFAAPADTIKFFAEKIKPAEVLDSKQMQRLLTDLGSENFAVRDAASKAIDRLDEQVVPYLEKALKTAQSLEHRVRVQRVIEQRQTAPPTATQLRQIRGVMVLERIGNDEAKTLLKRWASGPAGALLTSESAAALYRLGVGSKPNQ